MRISDWSSDVCSSDLITVSSVPGSGSALLQSARGAHCLLALAGRDAVLLEPVVGIGVVVVGRDLAVAVAQVQRARFGQAAVGIQAQGVQPPRCCVRSEESRGGKEWVGPCRIRR